MPFLSYALDEWRPSGILSRIKRDKTPHCIRRESLSFPAYTRDESKLRPAGSHHWLKYSVVQTADTVNGSPRPAGSGIPTIGSSFLSCSGHFDGTRKSAFQNLVLLQRFCFPSLDPYHSGRKSTRGGLVLSTSRAQQFRA